MAPVGFDAATIIPAKPSVKKSEKSQDSSTAEQPAENDFKKVLEGKQSKPKEKVEASPTPAAPAKAGKGKTKKVSEADKKSTDKTDTDEESDAPKADAPATDGLPSVVGAEGSEEEKSAEDQTTQKSDEDAPDPVAAAQTGLVIAQVVLQKGGEVKKTETNLGGGGNIVTKGEAAAVEGKLPNVKPDKKAAGVEVAKEKPVAPKKEITDQQAANQDESAPEEKAPVRPVKAQEQSQAVVQSKESPAATVETETQPVKQDVTPALESLAAGLNDQNAQSQATAHVQGGAVVAAPVATPQDRFVADNHPQIVTSVKTKLLPDGGAMQLRLDPPDLGPLRLDVRMENGMMSASFSAVSDKAADLLNHSLGDLKKALESAGITVDKLQVKQGSADQFSDSSGDSQQQRQMAQDGSSAQQEQQRRAMLNRMWKKVAGEDPFDVLG